MNLYYGAKAAGTHHLQEGKCCQDSCLIFRLPEGGMGFVLADGVGSASMAALASSRACTCARDFIKVNYPLMEDEESVLALLNGAMNRSMKDLYKLARDSGLKDREFDTTLMIVLMTGSGEEQGTRGRHVYTAGVGDGGIIGLSESGSYRVLYAPRKGEDGSSVIPLRWGPSEWEIRKAEGTYASVLAATDGLLDALFMPPLLKMDPYGPQADIPMLRQFMDPALLEEKAGPGRSLQEYMEKRITDPEDLAGVTDDDRTVCALIDPACRVPEPSCCEKPDYKKLLQMRDQLIRGELPDTGPAVGGCRLTTPDIFWAISRRGDPRRRSS